MSNQPMQHLSSRVVMEAVVRAMDRASVVTNARFCRGVNSLATIAVIAPFLGILLTLPGIIGAFIGCGGERSTCMAAIVSRLSYAIARCPLGLLVGILAYCMYHFLCRQLKELALDMHSATLELANVLCVIPLRK
ncbi:MotA/TolQ/ExbB proton channel family protein [Paludibaculum fermentans]|uniref:MotA/TolQ/ExbB proton channel family protein n=1 Tax=Paludibaculum fermentans TaxID=1473598 RepID=UPI003EBFB26B